MYIPNRRSKAGKRFAFVRFIKVDNVDRLVGNLCTLWIGRMYLQANVVRFERSPIQSSRLSPPNRPPKTAPSYASAAKGILTPPLSAPPAMVLDDSCSVYHDLENYVIGEIKQFASINNLRVLLANEGFSNMRIVYLGGLWVMIELPSAKSKSKLMKHVGVASWFKSLSNAQSDFLPRDRIVWVDVEGVPMHAWSRNTFHKIGSKWGEVLDLEESRDDFFARKRICIKTNQEDNILEKFKIIVKGKICVIRAKELFVWSPSFTEVAEKDYNSEGESDKETGENHSVPLHQFNAEEESDNEAISDTMFGENDDEQGNADDSVLKETSYDPFKIYDLLHKNDKVADVDGTNSSIPFPPGFTPEKVTPIQEAQNLQEDHDISIDKSVGCSSRIAESTQKVDEQLSPRSHGNGHKIKKGGSILGILEEMIKVGQTIGFNMEGCTNDMEKIIGSQGVDNETKSDNISDMVVKNIWGNSIFEASVSESIGNSGALLCVWDPKAFHKEHHIISDNFIALYGTWSSNQTKMLLISVYAPQAVSLKSFL
ncbi:RNA-directed DNA polymerase, eukaryota [Tanacetum coccineum]